MAYMFQIIETETQPALAVRTVTSAGNLPQMVGPAYGAIIAYLAEMGQQPLGPAFIAYYNLDMEKLQVEIGFPVAQEIAGRGDIIARPIPAGKRAAVFHLGPYSELASTYDALAKWIADRGYEPTGTAYEFYYNSPAEVPESQLLTKIEFLLK